MRPKLARAPGMMLVIGIRGSYMDRIIFSNQMHCADSNTPEGLAAAISDRTNERLQLPPQRRGRSANGP